MECEQIYKQVTIIGLLTAIKQTNVSQLMTVFAIMASHKINLLHFKQFLMVIKIVLNHPLCSSR